MVEPVDKFESRSAATFPDEGEGRRERKKGPNTTQAGRGSSILTWEIFPVAIQRTHVGARAGRYDFLRNRI